MRKSILVKTKSEVLRRLREMLGFSAEEIAKKLKTTPEKIKQVENGKDSFTLSQIKKLSNIYHISLAAFFSDSIPEIPTIPDYRLNREKRLNPQVFIAQRRAYYLSKEIALLSNKKSEIPSFKIGITPKELAHVFREYLGLEVIKNKNPKEILREYKSRIEQKMFVPIVEYPLKAEDVRAFSMYSDISIIVLNEKDRPELKLFSLFHEIGHLLTKSSALCSIEIELENRGIESYCNRFSAEFLVPENDLKTEIESRDLSLFDQDAVSELAKVYGVSKQVIMIRLLRFGYINKKDYEQFKSRYEESKKELEKRKRFGRRNWEEVFFNRAGGLVISEMKKAYKRGEITPVDVATALEMRTKYVEKFIEG